MLEAFSLLICCWKAEWGPDAGIFITFIGLALEYGNKLGLALKKGKQIWLLFCIKRKHKGNSVQEACAKGFAVHNMNCVEDQIFHTDAYIFDSWKNNHFPRV